MASVDSPIASSEDEAPIYGEILEEILSHVPLTDLVPASHVSKTWNKAVFSSLRNLNPPKPWLFLRRQNTSSPYATATRAYDPRSHVWIDIFQPSIKYISTLKSSHSNFLYMLSPSKLSFSFDPLNLTWNHVEAPLVWRYDPIVANVGDSIIVAGGSCDFEDDPLAVEIYDMKNRRWRACESMPESLRDCAASTWLSVATTSEKLYVMEKSSGATHFFDVETSDWSGPYSLRIDPNCFYSDIGCVNDCLILVGLIGKVEKVEIVKIWEVDFEGFSGKEIGEMPAEFVEKLRSETFGTCSVKMCLAGNVVYIYNPAVVTEEVEMVVCEVVNDGGGGCRWSNLKMGGNDGCGGGRLENVVVTCAEVGIEDLDLAMKRKDWRIGKLGCGYKDEQH